MTKFSTVKTIFKEGNKNFIAKYRPVSLLPSFSKIFEKVIHTHTHTHTRLYQHCTESNILSKHQYGFQLNSSTEKATFNLLMKSLMPSMKE